MEKKALNACHPELQDMNPVSIIPYLNGKGLLASDELSTLYVMTTNIQKNNKIMEILPTKGKGWWNKFLDCLEKSANGNPQHTDLIKYLEDALLKEQQKAKDSHSPKERRVGDPENEEDAPRSKRRRSDDPENHQQPPVAEKQPPSKPEIDVEKLQQGYMNRFGKGFPTLTNRDQLKDEQVCVLIQTVNDNEFRAAMLQLKEGSTVSMYAIDDALCDSQSYYFVGKWGDGEIPVAIIQTNMGTSGVYGSWYETKKALKNLPQLKYIFAVGICGGVKERVEMGEVIVSKVICGYTELKITQTKWINRAFKSVATEKPFYRYLSQTANKPPNTKLGEVLSGPWLIKSTGIQEELLKLCPDAIAFEMEGIGIVQACDGKDIEYLVVKGVSDFGDESKNDKWQPQAATNAAKTLCEVMTKAPHFFKCNTEE